MGTVTAVRPPARFGSLDIEGDYVKSFGEKIKPKRVGLMVVSLFLNQKLKNLYLMIQCR